MRLHARASAAGERDRTLTHGEAYALVAIVRIFGEVRIARRLGVATYTLDHAQRGFPIRRASLARIRTGLRHLASAPTFQESSVLQ